MRPKKKNLLKIFVLLLKNVTLNYYIMFSNCSKYFTSISMKNLRYIHVTTLSI